MPITEVGNPRASKLRGNVVRNMVLAALLLGAVSRPASAQADFNGDGIADIVFRNTTTGDNLVWLMSASGAITGAYSLPRVSDSAWRILAVSDVNGDHRPDLVWSHARSTSSSTFVWLMDGPTIIGTTSIWAWIDPFIEFSVQAIADFNGDGYADFLARTIRSETADPLWNSPTRLLLTANSVANGLGSALRSVVLPDVLDPGWTMELAADFNGDEHADPVWRHRPTGEHLVWIVDLTSGQVVSSLVLPRAGAGAWMLMQAADLDGNGSTDLLWRNPSNGALQLQYLSGVNVQRTVSLPTTGVAWNPVSTAAARSTTNDFNEDLSGDLVARDTRDGSIAVFDANPFPTVADLDWKLVLVHDFNADGYADLIWRNTLTGHNQVWFLASQGFWYAADLPRVEDQQWQLVGAGDFRAPFGTP